MNLEEEREALQRLGQTITRQNGKSQMVAEETMRKYRDACDALAHVSAEWAKSLCDAVEALAEVLRGALCSMSFSFEEFAREVEEGMAEPDGRDWQRDREREAIPREQARDAARYKAHRRMMTEHKARQHLRRRKYRSGANAGWY